MVKGQIHTFRCGKSNSYLFENKNGMLLIDAGGRGLLEKLNDRLNSAGRSADDVKLIVITHTHYDHTDSLAAVKSYTGAPVAVHRSESGNLSRGYAEFPPGTSFFPKVISSLAKLAPRTASFAPVKPDILVNKTLDLGPYGFPGRAVHTPGHTGGSLSVIINRHCFCGDAVFNILPGRLYPPFAEDTNELCRSWKLLLDTGCTVYYPGHGKPVPSGSLEQAFKKCVVK